MNNLATFAVIGAAFLLPSLARADDQLSPLAVNGDWMAFSHSQSVEDAPDICIASSTPAYGVILRIDDQGDIDLRLVNDSWSLPADVTGNIALKISSHTYSYAIQSNTSTMVDAPISQDQLTSLVGDMEAADSLQIIAGSAKPETVPLDGSKSVLTAFMTCAGIPNPSNDTGGGNPFASKSAQ